MTPIYISIALTILSILFCSCTQTETPIYESLDATSTETLKFHPLNDTFEFGYASKILQYDSLLIVYDEMQEEKIQFFHKKSGRHLGAFGRIGQGDKELVSPANLSINKSNAILSLYDYAKGQLLACKLTDSPITNPEAWYTIDLPEYEIRPKSVIPLTDNEFVALNGKPRFTKARGNEVIASFDLFPILPKQEADDPTTRMFFLSQSLLDVKPDGQKMVEGTIVGSIMQIFDLKSSAIESSAVRYFHKPIFSVQKGQIGMLPETIYGFTCLHATDKYIYATLFGVANPTVYPNSIYIFDWKGNLVKRFSTDQQICCFCVDEQDGKIYTMVISGSGEQILGFLI